MKVIINTPSVSIPAGVANHYLGLKKYFSNDIIYNEYMPGSDLQQKYGKVLTTLIIPFLKVYDTVRFIFLLFFYRNSTVLLNPSFGKTALQRDAFFIRIATCFKCKIVVFIHGWDKRYLQEVFDKKEKFSNVWYKADAFFVLASEFKNYLLELGVTAPIYLTTTKVNDKMLKGVKFKNISSVQNLLFLSRVEKEKGIFVTIDTFELLHKKYPELKLTIVGRGNALNEAESYVKKKELSNIRFTGALYGDNLSQEFLKGDIFILPSYSEGMPTVVLEAMAFGLPVITRPVGGLVDFFKDDKMGYMIESFDSKAYAEKIESLINDIDKTNEIATYNMQYAKEHFLASKVANELETILRNDL